MQKNDNPFLVSDAIEPPSDLGSASEAEEEPAQTIIWRQEALVVGPTPQKYGRVLGLFDASPAHLAPSPKRIKLSSPSKKRKSDTDLVLSAPSPARTSQTPQKTPSFLKRQASTLTLDDADVSSTSRLLFQPKCVSSLSAIIKQNRLWYDADTQDDDALDALREAEGEEMVLPDAQHTSSDEDADDAVTEETGKVRWKKKGLKRSRRRVVMRPQAPKATTAPALPSSDRPLGVDTDSDEEIGDEEVAAKQHQPTMDEEVPEWLEKENLEIRDKAEARKQEQQAANKTGRKPRAVSANYKSLKLRNTGAKGGSRFGRGRFGGRR
ncbi:DNA replication and checkpoint protein-domain-containing protein [Protomyces lactucae-debilis]|uniref:DNA replication regulator SLD2 n=1 Tax=Protomyces lactucae-debilis TaxID=2754530 RepID=A0A1Y2FC27_PROLT|nr:DNA replication and checkpoint protein-domain-containing protein [Protomyces lactucae-debilis]ORY81480.1 DNA replication and checkpoint protein-domain-containing protein [Protomyces lactucae-debilis]